jgi:hypothetical protein
MKIVHNIRHGLKGMKIYYLNKQTKVGMNGNYLFSMSKLTTSCSQEKEVLEKYS